MQNRGFASFAAVCFRRLFRSRNIIVISDHKIDHYPLSAKLQLLGLCSLIGFVCWASYSTGSFMAARSVLKEKDQKIYSTYLENRRIGSEFSLLKRDLLKLQQQDGEMSDYARFILDQYDDKSSLAASPKENDRVLERIAFLEHQVETLRDDNRHFVETVRQKTEGKIHDFENIIRMTGLNPQRLMGKSARLAALEEDTGSRQNSAGIPKQEKKSNARGLGGPFLPLEPLSKESEERKLFTDIDHMLTLHDLVGDLPLSQPIKNAELMSTFGKRVDPFTKRWATHTGVDLAGPYGASIYAPADGKVICTGIRGAYGKMIDVSHGHGVVTRYGHLSKILVQEGQTIKKGQLIGLEGSTGRSTGAHLHYEVRYFDRPMNPLNFLKVSRNVQ